MSASADHAVSLRIVDVTVMDVAVIDAKTAGRKIVKRTVSTDAKINGMVNVLMTKSAINLSLRILNAVSANVDSD